MYTHRFLINRAMRTVFFISDSTGITAETLGRSLLSQFEGMKFRQTRVPFVDSVDNALDCVERMTEAKMRDGERPIVVTSIVNAEVARTVRQADALFLDMFEHFVGPLEEELGQAANHNVGRQKGMEESADYQRRIEAINFSLAHDDGMSHKELAQADVILVGVSRSGKTPTSLYMAMQFGVKVANYPLIPEDFERNKLPTELVKYRAKLFGLTISPERLSQIREERRRGSHYASIENCRFEVEAAQKLMRMEGIRWLDSTHKSIEEIAAIVLQAVQVDENAY